MSWQPGPILVFNTYFILKKFNGLLQVSICTDFMCNQIWEGFNKSSGHNSIRFFIRAEVPTRLFCSFFVDNIMWTETRPQLLVLCNEDLFSVTLVIQLKSPCPPFLLHPHPNSAPLLTSIQTSPERYILTKPQLKFKIF